MLYFRIHTPIDCGDRDVLVMTITYDFNFENGSGGGVKVIKESVHQQSSVMRTTTAVCNVHIITPVMLKSINTLMWFLVHSRYPMSVMRLPELFLKSMFLRHHPEFSVRCVGAEIIATHRNTVLNNFQDSKHVLVSKLTTTISW